MEPVPVVRQQVVDDGEDLKDVVVVEDEEYERLKDWYNFWKYLSGGTGVTLSGVLGWLGYLYYRTNRCEMIWKYFKNNVEELENDIIENIVHITDIETGENARKVLRRIQSKLLEIAKEKLPPKN